MPDNREFYHISLKLILKNDEGKVLILRALDTGTFGGYHDFPGGRIDKNEFSVPLTEILHREALEEVGLSDIEINPMHVGVGRHVIFAKFTSTKEKDIPVLYLFFEGKLKSGEPRISEEHSGVEWVNLDEIDIEKYFTSGILEGVRTYLNK